MAQDSEEQKTKIYFDTRETIEILSGEAAAGSNIFDEIKDLKEAKAFKSDKGGYVVEFTDTDGDYSYKAYTDKEFELIQQKVTNYIITQDRHSKGNLMFSSQNKRVNINNKRIQYSQFYEKEINESGRNTFIVGATLLGLFSYGPAIGNLTSKSRNGTALLPYLGAVYGSTIAAWQYAERHPVSYGGASQYIGSSILGRIHGPLIYDMFVPQPTLKKVRDEVGVTLLTSLTEGITGFYVAQRGGISPGQSIMATGTSFWMIPESYALVLGFNKAYNVKDQFIVNGFVLGMSLYGYYLGYSLTKTFSYTIGDAIVYNNVMMLSGFAFSSLAFSINKYKLNAGNINLVGGIAALFAPVGIYASEALLKGRDFKAGQGIIISLATVGGGLISSAILSKERRGNNEQIRVLEHFLYGALSGFSLSYIYETKHAQTGLLGKLNDQNMRLTPTLCNTAAPNQFPSFSNSALGFQFDWKF